MRDPGGASGQVGGTGEAKEQAKLLTGRSRMGPGTENAVAGPANQGSMAALLVLAFAGPAVARMP